MRNFSLIWVVGVMLFSITSVSLASSVNHLTVHGNESEDKRWEISPQFDYVFEKDDSDGDEFSMSAFGVQAKYDFSNSFQGYVGLGLAKIEYDSVPFFTSSIDAETDQELIGTIGVTAKLVDLNESSHLDLDVNYRYSEMDFDVTLGPILARAESEYMDWQATLLAVHEGESANFYAGVRYHDFDLDVSGGGSVNSDDVVGVVVGVEFGKQGPATLGIQGRFIDETAIGLNLGFEF